MQCGKADDLEYGVFRQFVLRNVAENSCELVGEEYREQHHCDRQPGLGDFTKYVSIENAEHCYIGDFPGI